MQEPEPKPRSEALDTTEAMTAAPVQAAGEIIGPYRLMDLLGTGAWARYGWPSRSSRCGGGWR